MMQGASRRGKETIELRKNLLQALLAGGGSFGLRYFLGRSNGMDQRRNSYFEIGHRRTNITQPLASKSEQDEPEQITGDEAQQ